MLLFFDQIQVIRPAEVDHPQYHEANQAIFELAPDAFAEIRKRHYEMSLVPQNKKMLSSLLDSIATKRRRYNDRRMILNVDDSGGLSIPGYLFLHVSKLNPWVLTELKNRSLILTTAESLLQRAGMQDFRIVEQHACNLVLALLADHYGKEQGLRTITDEQLGYIANAFNVDPLRQHEMATMNLASAIIRVQIPDKIETLTPRDYVDLRERYEALREPFHLAVRDIYDDYKLAGINSKKEFDAVVREACRDFCAETERVRRTWWAKRVQNWTIMGLGVLSSFCSLGTGQTVALAATTGISVALHVYQALRTADQSTDKRNAQQLLGELKAELAHPMLFRRITLPPGSPKRNFRFCRNRMNRGFQSYPPLSVTTGFWLSPRRFSDTFRDKHQGPPICSGGLRRTYSDRPHRTAITA